MRGHSSHPSAFLDSSCAQCHPSPVPPRTTHTPLVVFQFPKREEGAWGPWPGIPCLPSPSPAQLLASAPPQLDSNPLEAAANSAESSNLQGLHKLAFSAKCSPGEEEEELGSRGWGWGSVAEHSSSAITLPKRLPFRSEQSGSGGAVPGGARGLAGSVQGELTGQAGRADVGWLWTGGACGWGVRDISEAQGL